ncbi:hypothetical protein IWW56_001563 [Coemansia sp. RSA 2131]|nr:hypothetical protein IWW56_001563 [Coemansia sp. RSA 2131]
MSTSDLTGSSLHDKDDAVSVSSRRVHIPTIPHSAMNAHADAKHSSESTGSDDSESRTGLPYGLPSAGNGVPLGQGARDGDADAAAHEGRKVSGLRAALVSKFAAKKKPKELSMSGVVNSKRHQQQLESLMSQSVTSLGESGGGPTVGGQTVGHPMSFQHVEHLSPTQVAPKMPLINGTQQAQATTPPSQSLDEPAAPKPVAPERRLNFRNFKPTSLLTRPSKLSIGSSGSSDSGHVGVTLRGKPIGAPQGFQHVDHISSEEYGMQQFHLLNHRQQQSEIVSVLRQNSLNTQGGSDAPSRGRTASLAARHEKLTFHGLPVSGPVSFEHVEHVSADEYKQHLEETVRKATVAAAAANVDTLLPPKQEADSASDSGADADSGVEPMPSARPSVERLKIPALQHTSQTARPSMGDLGPAKSGKLPSTVIQELQARANQQSPSTESTKAKAGISKARQISSPFNVQHDVHISVEDLDDIMQQVPDTLKAYISPMRSPSSDHRVSEAQDVHASPPSTPIFAEMTSRRRCSTGNEEAMTAQMARAKLGPAGDSAGADGPGTPGWLPRIVSVSSPPGVAPHNYRKQRTVSGYSASVLDGTMTSRSARMSTTDVASSEPRARTPVSAPIRSSMHEDSNTSPSTVAAVSHSSDMPDTPQSAVPRIDSTEPSNDSGNWDNNETNSHAGPQSTEKVEVAEGIHAKWIKRKSRVMSTLGVALLAKGITKITVPVPTLVPDSAKRHTMSPDSLSAAALAKADAIARLEKNATQASTTSLPTTNPFRALTSEQEAPNVLTPSSTRSEQRPGTTSGKSSKKRRENYGELEEYAEGESGSLYLATRNVAAGKRPRGEYVAVKVVPKSAKARYRKLRTELKILRRIRSQHVVRFYEYFSIDDSVWIVYEFMGRGSITDLLAGYPEIRMPAITISYTMHEVLTALAYLHERHIVHCDVRSDNVLINDKGLVKLADFSSAVYLEADQTSVQKTSLGAIYWMAPELAKGAGYSAATDVWAAGSLLYEMLEGQPPYIEYPDIKVLELSNANGMPALTNPDSCDASLVELMLQCTAVAPADRLQASRLRKHESVVSQDAAQCAQLMIDFVLQVESLEDQDDIESCGDPC